MRKITDEEHVVAHFTNQPVEWAQTMLKVVMAIMLMRQQRQSALTQQIATRQWTGLEGENNDQLR